jgi:hypothetical protein
MQNVGQSELNLNTIRSSRFTYRMHQFNFKKSYRVLCFRFESLLIIIFTLKNATLLTYF